MRGGGVLHISVPVALVVLFISAIFAVSRSTADSVASSAAGDATAASSDAIAVAGDAGNAQCYCCCC